MRLVTNGTMPQRPHTWKLAVRVPNEYCDTCDGSASATRSTASGLEVQTPPCLVQKEHSDPSSPPRTREARDGPGHLESPDEEEQSRDAGELRGRSSDPRVVDDRRHADRHDGQRSDRVEDAKRADVHRGEVELADVLP